MKSKKTKLKRIILSLVLVFAFALTFVQQQTPVAAKTKSFITASKFKGYYEPADTSYPGSLSLTIKSIKNGKVKFVVEDCNLSQALDTDTITGKIKDNKVSFKFTDSFCNEGKGTLVFYKSGTIKLTIKSNGATCREHGVFYSKNVVMKKEF